MLRRKHHNGRPSRAVPATHNPLNAYAHAFLEWSQATGRTAQTVDTRARALRRFIAWCDERGIEQITEVSLPMLERYQRALYLYRKANGEPMAFGSQLGLLTPIRSFFQWATRHHHIRSNPASELVLPRLPQHLPKHMLSVADIELILHQPDTRMPSGVRDRAMLETFYSTGLRRMELVQLRCYDIDTRSGCIAVHGGKGGRDRVVPVGARACAWLVKYRDEVRPLLVAGPDEAAFVLTDFGEPFINNRLGTLVKRYIVQAGFHVTGSCHLFRHACATHMLEGGADIRFIQAMLGHANLETTQIYTQVSIQKLKEIHAATHPARLTRVRGDGHAADDAGPVDQRAALLEVLAAEREDEAG